jgi:hypothetical protein
VPGVRLFLVDLGGTPGAPAAPNAPLGRIDITLLIDGAYSYRAVSTVSGPVTIELWPAATSGLSVVVDPSAKAPAAVANSTVDLKELEPSDKWWVVAIQTLPDGRRAAIAVVVQPGVNPPIDTTLGWLLGHL